MRCSLLSYLKFVTFFFTSDDEMVLEADCRPNVPNEMRTTAALTKASIIEFIIAMSANESTHTHSHAK